MSAKRALIVDDSKSARAVLSRMLEQHSLEVDTVESAEQAIEYLGHHRPDVIFMDHLMPGMDGFQAVQAIKNNPRTATIPIMMYTSQEGDLYVGQARALGATGVLPKQLRPVDVSKVLYQLNLLPERRDSEVARIADARAPSVVVIGESPSSQLASGQGKGDVQPLRPAAGDLRGQIESLIKEQTTELRRFVIASLDSYASRVVSDMRGVPGEAAEPAPHLPLAPSKRNFVFGVVAATVVVLGLGGLALWLGKNLARLKDEQAALVRQTTSLEQANRQMAATISQLSAGTAERSASYVALPALVPPARVASDEDSSAAGTTGTAPLPVPYGEVPLSGQRVEALRAMLKQLRTQSFHGTLVIDVYGGRFCLVGNATDGFSPAPDDLPYSKCDLVGNPALDGMAPAQRQSLNFVNMVSDEEQRSGGALKVNVASGSSDRPAMPYPNAAAEGLTAGQWNRAASVNNRLEITVVPGT